MDKLNIYQSQTHKNIDYLIGTLAHTSITLMYLQYIVSAFLMDKLNIYQNQIHKNVDF